MEEAVVLLDECAANKLICLSYSLKFTFQYFLNFLTKTGCQIMAVCKVRKEDDTGHIQTQLGYSLENIHVNRKQDIQ